jgi:hypothetical protein
MCWSPSNDGHYSPKHVKIYFFIKKIDEFVRFEVFTAMTMKNDVFWDVASCRFCVNLRFGATYRLHFHGRKIRERGCSVSRWLQPPKRRFTQDLHDPTSYKTAFFIVEFDGI